MKQYILILLSFILACRSGAFSPGSRKDQNQQDKPQGENQPDSGNSQAPQGTSTPLAALPPEMVTGGYLTCETFDTGPGSTTKPANVGCIAYKKDGSKLDVHGADISWTIADSQGNPAQAKDLSLPSNSVYDHAWTVDQSLVVQGFQASLASGGISIGSTNSRTTHGAFDCSAQTLSDGTSFEACANFPHNASNTLVRIPAQSVTNYMVTLLNMDQNTGVCGSIFSTTKVLQTQDSESSDFLTVKVIPDRNWNTTAYYCIEVDAQVQVGGKQETVSVYIQ